MEISNTDISTFINMVDTFYNNAWNRLVLYGALIIVIVGIVIPIILQYTSRRVQQGKNIEMENKLREEFTSFVNLKGKSIEEKDKNIIDNYFKEKERIIENKLVQLRRDISHSKGLSFHNLGLRKATEGEILVSTLFYISAGRSYLDAQDETNLKIILENIEKNCLGIDKIEDLFEFEEVKKELNSFISKIEKEFTDKRYSLEIIKINKAIFNISKTKK